MAIRAKTMVIYPKGDLTNRILVMVSAVVFCKEKNLEIKMIWDHEIRYGMLFLGNIDVVPISYFEGKNYIYNPNVDQSVLYNDMIADNESDMYVIIETDKEVIWNGVNYGRYLKDRTITYKKLLKEYMSGNLLGQISLVDFPNDTKYYCSKGAETFNTSLKELVVSDDMFNVENKEVLEYIKTLVYCKADVLICTNEHMDKTFNDASNISLTTVIYTKHLSEDEKTVLKNKQIPNYSEGYMGYGVVINPDINKISLL